MSRSWFVRAAGKVHGPFDAAAMRGLVAARKLTPSMEVGNGSHGPWTRAGSVAGLFPVVRGAARPPAAGGHVPPSLPSAPMGVVDPPAFPADAIAPSDANPSTKKPSKSRGSLAMAWGGVGGVMSVVVCVGVISYNLYLTTDTAAERLIKTSMQETLSQNADVPQPVTVRKVDLNGKGQNRTGRATIKFGQDTRVIPFTATVRNVGRDLTVEWRTDQLPVRVAAVQPSPSTPKPAKTRRQSGGTESPNPEQMLARYNNLFQKWLLTLTEIDALETQWGAEDAEFTPAQRSNIAGKLATKWGAAQVQSQELRAFITSSMPNQAETNGELRAMFSCLLAVENSAPALRQVLGVIVSSADGTEIEANEVAYWNLSQSIADAIEAIQESE